MAQARRREARRNAELVAIHHPKDPEKLAQLYRDLAAKVPSTYEETKTKQVDPEELAERNAQGMIKLALALGDEKSAKRVAQRALGGKILRNLKRKAGTPDG